MILWKRFFATDCRGYVLRTTACSISQTCRSLKWVATRRDCMLVTSGRLGCTPDTNHVSNGSARCSSCCDIANNTVRKHISGGVHDQIEQYNSMIIEQLSSDSSLTYSCKSAVNRDVTVNEHPRAIRPLLPEIDAFNRFCHFEVLFPILRYIFRL